MAPRAGLEPATYGLTVRRFYLLNYRGILVQMTRFEHATFCSQSRRSTKLSYIWILVRMERIELSRCFHPGILSPMRLPVPPHSHSILFLFYRLINIVVIKDIGQGPSSYAAFWEQYWCVWRDLNSHALRHWILNPACLPIPPQTHKKRRDKTTSARLPHSLFWSSVQVGMRWGFLFLQPLRLLPYRLHNGSPGRTRTYNSLINSQVQLPIVLLRNNGGWCRIRTYGTFQHDGFQDRCLKPTRPIIHGPGDGTWTRLKWHGL